MGSAGNEELVQAGLSCGEEKILVSVRLRPLNEKEISRNDASDWDCSNGNTVVYKNALSVPERSMYPAAYTFDRVFGWDCSTRKVYEEGAKEVALSVVSGINSSIFAYGQTSSGKTYTMSGITEYSIADIYKYINNHQDREFFLKFSAMEIYNESVRDLLSADSTPLRLLDDPERGTIVEKLTEESLVDWDHLQELLAFCRAQRQIGETALNETSSRSHQIIRLTIESSGCQFLSKDHSTLTATVNFVDLAGSERASQSLSAGSRLKEGCHINRSLLTLGTVIRKLGKGRNGHIPFRDSKLTRILQSSLAGNARTAIICTMSPAHSHVEQSRNTLLFGSCAKEVSTNAQVNIVMSDKALVKHLQRELARMEAELKNSGTRVTSDSAAVLRERDLQIEELKKEIAKLTLERDVAQTQVEDLLQAAGDDESSTSSDAVDHHYPQLRVRDIWVNENQSDISTSSFEASLNSDGSSRPNSVDHYLHIPYSEEPSLHSRASIELTNNNPENAGGRVSKEWDEIDVSGDELSEDICKDVQCIEIELSSTNKHVNSNAPCSEANIDVSGITEEGITDQAYQDSECLAVKEDSEISSFLYTYAPKSPEVQQNHRSDSRKLNLFKNRSCEENILTSYCSSLSEKTLRNDKAQENMLNKKMEKENLPSIMLENGVKEENTPENMFEKGIVQKENEPSSPLENASGNNENTPSNVLEKDLERPTGIRSKVSVMNSGAYEITPQQEFSPTSTISDFNVESDANDRRTSLENDIPSIDAFVDQMKEGAKLQLEKQFSESKRWQVPEEEQEIEKLVKQVKDVGLDPIQEDHGSPLNWSFKFKSLQGDIILLWDACNVSLVHRTYFFLLFKGDPTDDIYLEVEIRRLSFLKDRFSRGNRALEDSQSFTYASSEKTLQRERRMLSKRMHKLSRQYREGLYNRWGIGLKTRNRRMRFVSLLWTNTEDINHITDSANIVAKLVGLLDPGKVSKEMFGLNFTPQTTTSRSFRW